MYIFHKAAKLDTAFVDGGVNPTSQKIIMKRK